MKYTLTYVSMNEVPGEVAFVFNISNCPHRCPECHSPELQGDKGIELTPKVYERLLKPYRGYITAICFMGGDQHEEELLDLIKYEAEPICLYTGSTSVSPKLLSRLSWIKLGPYVEECGGLEDYSTNQRFYSLHPTLDLTYQFRLEH